VRRGALVGILLFCVAATASDCSARDSVAQRPGSRLGIAAGGNIQNLPAAERGRYLQNVSRAGARWLRFDLNWAMIQRKGRRSYDWAPFDRVVSSARRRGLAVLGTLLYTPSWARPGAASAATPPANLGDFAEFAAHAARHFGARGVHAYEIWNEPNLVDSWATGPDPARYTQMLRQAYTAIKRVDPSATVVSAGLSPYGAYGVSDSRGMNPLTFLSQMYASGAQGAMDAVGWHPYNFPRGLGYFPWSGWSQMFATSPSARSIMTANGDGKKKIWATEWGAPTGTATQAVSEAAQARLITAAVAKLTTWSWAGPSFLYSFRDHGTDPSDYMENFGIIRHDWTAKPAYSAFRRAAMRKR
jgi:polysaccharide biosynthesis protein PslG